MDNEDLLKQLLVNFQSFQVSVTAELASMRTDLSAFKEAVKDDVSELKTAVAELKEVQQKHDKELIKILAVLSIVGAFLSHFIQVAIKRFL